MQGYLLSVTLSVFAASAAQADDHGIIDEAHPSSFQHSLQPTSLANHGSTVEVSSQALKPIHAQRFQIDYQPFDNSFSMSASGFVKSAREALLNSRKPYLGVGWKKMLDQARLGMRVDFGAVYEERTGLDSAVTRSPSVAKNSADETEAARWQPVISFGMFYRF